MDATALAELVDMAGEGLPSYLWARTAQEGETALDVGRRRAQREEGSFSYRNAVVADEGDGAFATLIGYPLPEVPEPIADDMPPMFVPLQELENVACGTWYVNVLAVMPAHRNCGHGGCLLNIAEQQMRRTGRRGLSLVVSDTNFSARRLYERSGFTISGSRTKVKDAWSNAGAEWLLMMREPIGGNRMES